jgi:5-formyltetrahydrofolate cyclo-ligase
VVGQLGSEGSPKAALRREILAAREALAPQARAAASAIITQNILALDAWKNARCVLAYLSFGSEFATAALVENAAATGKQLCLPRVDRDARALQIHRVTDLSHDLQAGVFGIREPRPTCPAIALEAIDFVLVPGVAFTPRCERMGYGAGYYDRLIARFAQRPPLIAAAFTMQMRDRIPLSGHDRGVDLVITEDSSYCGC